MAHKVKCLQCGEIFDRDVIEYVQVGRRYMHKVCPNTFHADPEKVKIEQEKNQFYNYVKQIYGPKYNYQLINSQAESYIEEYGYTWSGMAGTLHWFYDIKHGSKDKGNGGIGIIPYVYDQAKEYYITIAKAEKENKDIKLLREPVVFNIQSPRAWHRPPQLLNMEDDE